MKRLEGLRIGLLLGVCLVLYSGSAPGAEDSFFEPSRNRIEAAVRYGRTADYKLNEFGGYDLGLNKFSLGDKTGYIDLLTPFARIAGSSLKMKDSGKSLSLEEAQKQGRGPVELRVFLYVRKEDLEDPIECLVETGTDSIDISGMVMEFSMCDDKTGDCVRSLSYLLPAEELKGEQEFRIMLRGERLGEKRVKIQAARIR